MFKVVKLDFAVLIKYADKQEFEVQIIYNIKGGHRYENEINSCKSKCFRLI